MSGFQTKEEPGYKRPLEFLLIAVGLIILFVSEHWVVGDGKVRFEALSALLENGQLDDSKYSMIGPVFSSVLYMLGMVFKSPEWWCARYNFVLLALGIGLILGLYRTRENEAILRKFFLILILGSNFPYHQVHYYGEVFTAVFVAIGIMAICHDRRVLGWILIILGVANTPASIVGLILVSIVLTLQDRQLRNLILPLAAVGLILMENTVRHGSPMATGYTQEYGFKTVMPYSGLPGFSYPFLFGLISILFSFGKGLIWYFPGLLLGVRKEMKTVGAPFFRSYQLWIWFLIGLVLIYATWWAWYGGAYWGPRFFLIASFPASMALAVFLSSDRPRPIVVLLVSVFVLWSFWVGLSGLIFHHRHLLICFENNCALEMLTWYVPEFSPLFRPFIVADPLKPRELIILVYGFSVAFYLVVPVAWHALNGLGRTYVSKIKESVFLQDWNW